MAIKKKIEEGLNKQINAEIYSSYLYLSMAAFFDSKNLKGFSNWMKVQAKEEMTHAMKMYNFLNDRGAKVILTMIDAPKTDWKSPLNVFEDIYKHEVHVTSLINQLVTLSKKEEDHATDNFLQWFVSEQVEEEASADEVVQMLKLSKESAEALFMIDQQLGQRVFIDPTQEKV